MSKAGYFQLSPSSELHLAWDSVQLAQRYMVKVTAVQRQSYTNEGYSLL